MQALKYFIPHNRRPQYKLRSTNLELVTVIECVCADGSSLKLGFMFPGKEHHLEWFDVDEDIRRKQKHGKRERRRRGKKDGAPSLVVARLASLGPCC